MFKILKLNVFAQALPPLTMRLLYASFIAFFSCWLACALWSFDKNDASFLFLSSQAISCTNYCGIWGAHVAALLFFLCGTAAFIIVPYLFFMAHSIFKKRSFRYTWDAWLAYNTAFLAMAGLCNGCLGDLYNVAVPGGVMGYIVFTTLTLCADTFLITLFLSLVLCASIVLVTRISFVVVGMYAVSCMRMLYQTFAWIHPWLWYGVTCIKKLMKAIYKLLNGAEVQESSSSIVDFELGNDGDDDAAKSLEEFWTQRFAQNIEQPKPSWVMHDEQEPYVSFENTVTPKKEIIYTVPSVGLFSATDTQNHLQDNLKNNQLLARVLEEKLARFGIQGTVVSIKVGPVITLFEYQPHIDTKISKIIALEDDLALALQAVSIRIIAPIPGKSVVGFEVANKYRRNVLLGKVLQSDEFKNSSHYIPLVLGEDSIGSTVIVDLATMPHLLVAGSTGSGKSVALNAMLISLLCKFSPEKLKLILVDPKRLEFAAYADIPHLLVPIVTDPRKASPVLRWVVTLMEERYAHMEQWKVRNIFDYHLLSQHNPELEPMPFLVIVIDELSDLMMTAAKDTEDLIARITQMARAAGIHMIVATQRPSVDVITGLIKVNFPSRISFRVTSKIDSRTILDCGGADKLLGKGDMLFLDSASRISRAHGAFVSDIERAHCIDFIKSQGTPDYVDIADKISSGTTDIFQEDEQLYNDIIEFIGSVDEISISLLQRKFRIGYNRSARLIDRLQAEGIILQEPGGKTRKVLK